MELRNRPIGVFDSGVGGLTVVSALTRHLPNETILYLGDTARLPYGTKSRDTVARYSRRNVEFLLSRGVKAVVIACNTATALALDTLDLALPLWGVVEPGAETAIRANRPGPIGVIATESTILSGAYRRALERLRPDALVIDQPCPLFVPLVEEGFSDDEVAQLVARRYLTPLLNAGIGTLVLGCTHYPLLAPILRSIVGPEVAMIDSAEAVARHVERDLAAADLLRSDTSRPQHHFCVTDVHPRFARLAQELLHHFHEKEHPPLQSISLEWVEV